MEEERESKSRSINLYCPAVAKMAQIIAREDQRLDLGSIARTFGLEPSTLKLNGHFISRGVDLVASSVTWSSLLSFFSSKGLPTGGAAVSAAAALVVDGKLSRPGTKRSHDLTTVLENGLHSIKLCEEIGKNPQHGEIKYPDTKKLKESNHGKEFGLIMCENNSQKSQCSNTGLKRKHWLQNISPWKRLRAIRNSNDNSRDDGERGSIRSLATNLPCGYLLRENMKRVREDEALMAAAFKRTRIVE